MMLLLALFILLIKMVMRKFFVTLLNLRLFVPGREGILIHIGNTSEDTDGCILVGFVPLVSSNPHLLKSTSAYLRLVSLLNRYDCDCFTIEIRNK